MQGIIRAAQSAGWWWPFSETCVITDRPSRLEHNGTLLHCDDGPAIAYRDGAEYYAWQGLAVPKILIIGHEHLSIRKVLRMPTWGMRKLALHRYGTERFLRDSNARVIHSDDFGILYRAKFTNSKVEGENRMAVVKVINATPEKDGSFRDYFLQVPPEMKTAREAVAWTFGLGNREYAPDFET